MAATDKWARCLRQLFRPRCIYSLLSCVVAAGAVSMESFVLRFFGKRRPIRMTTSPVLMDLNTFMASSCFIPCNDFPFTTRISSPVKCEQKPLEMIVENAIFGIKTYVNYIKFIKRFIASPLFEANKSDWLSCAYLLSECPFRPLDRVHRRSSRKFPSNLSDYRLRRQSKNPTLLHHCPWWNVPE